MSDQEADMREQRRIAENLEEFYNPQAAAAKRRKRLRWRAVLQETFVGGIPYDEFDADGRLP